MKNLEFLAQQQALLDKIYPPNMRLFWESQRAVTEQLKIQSVLQDFKPVADMVQRICYAKDVYRLEDFIDASSIVEKLAAVRPFKFADFDFVELTVEKPSETAVVIQEAKTTKRIIADVYRDHSCLLTLEPRKFEELIADLLAAKGFEVELTQQTRDNGFDILAIKKTANEFPLKFLVECKRFKENGVGVEIIRSFKNVVDEQNANKGIIATTSYFTRDALKKKEQYPYLLDFRDKNAVIDWVKEYYVERIRC